MPLPNYPPSTLSEHDLVNTIANQLVAIQGTIAQTNAELNAIIQLQYRQIALLEKLVAALTPKGGQ